MKVSNEELFERMKNGDSSARELIAQNNYRLAHYFAHKYHFLPVDYDDRYSAALFGLTKAIDSYNPEKGAKFATFAALCIRNEILILNRTEKKHKDVSSLDSPIYQDKDGSDLLLIDVIEDKSDAQDYDMKEAHNIAQVIVNALSERDKQIYHYFIENYNQKTIGEMLGITQSVVSRIIRNILKKIEIASYYEGLKQVEPKEGYQMILSEEEYKKLRNKGLTNVEISKKFGKKESWVYAQKKKWDREESSNKEADNSLAPTKEAYQHLYEKTKMLEKDLQEAKERIQELEISSDDGQIRTLNAEINKTVKERDAVIMTLKLLLNKGA